jgi:hypothetical protein
MNAHANPYENATRFDLDATHNQKADALIEALDIFGLQKVVLFWSPLDGGSDTDGAATNFPLLSAVVVRDGADGEPDYKVFDGSFLKVGGGNRSYSDVKRVLDCVESLLVEKAFFGLAVMPFTSHLEPKDAVAKMLDSKLDLPRFTSETRPLFFEVRNDGVTEEVLASN